MSDNKVSPDAAVIQAALIAGLADSREVTPDGELFRFTLAQRQWLRDWGKRSATRPGKLN